MNTAQFSPFLLDGTVLGKVIKKISAVLVIFVIDESPSKDDILLFSFMTF